MNSFPDQSHINCVRDALWSRSAGGASLMVGAGFSRNAEKSRPDAPEISVWTDLATPMYRALYPSEYESPSSAVPAIWSQSGAILRLAQEYETAFGEQKLYELVESHICDDCFTPGEIHARFLRLPWCDAFTTNWDTLLERTRPSVVNRAYDLVRTLDEIPHSPRPRIVKLHGCLSVHSKLIITEEDYRTYQIQYAPFVNTVQQAMMETVFCLIGFSGDDPNFLHWSGWVRDNLGPAAPKIYLAGWLDLSPHHRRMLESRNVMPIDLAQHPRAATKWPDGLQHRYATEWLLTTLELGRPYDISDWPLLSTTHEPTPATYLEPIERVHSPLPKSEHTPIRNLNGKTEDETDPIKQIIEIWAHNRKLYPEWLVMPFRRLQQLSFNTEEWHDVILKALPLRNPADRLVAIGELIWRKCILMEPFSPELKKATVEILDAIDCRASTIEGSSNEHLDWPEIRSMWVMSAAALVTQGRHQLNWNLFDEWTNKLSSFRAENPDIDHRLHHETCLWAATALDYKGLSSALAKWDVSGSDPAWMMRKSALLFEAGSHSEATNLIDCALATVREHTPDNKSLANPSREGWALWSALKREDLFENPIDAVRKWEELAVLKCNANVERDLYAEAIKDKSEMTDAPPFDLGMVAGEGISFSNAEYDKYLAAYRAIRLTEQAGLPLAKGDLVVASGILRIAAEALCPHEPEMAARLILRITKYDKDKRFNSILSRSRVASMEEDSINRLTLNLLDAIDFALPRISAPGEDGRVVFWLERLRVAVEALSRLVVRVEPQMADQVFEKALKWYRTNTVAMDPWMTEPVGHVLSRSWEALPKAYKEDRLLDLLLSPIVGMDGFSAFDKRYIELAHLLLKDASDFNRTPDEESRWQDAVQLLVRGLKQGGEARERASFRMFWISSQGVLTVGEEREVVEALWGPDYGIHENLPQGTSLYDWTFLTLPEPETGLSERRFRRRWLNTAIVPTEAGDEIGKILWKVGMAIRGLEDRERQLLLSQDEQDYLTSVIAAWSEMPVPARIRISGSEGSPFIRGKKTAMDALEGLESILLKVDIPEADASKLYDKILKLRSQGIRTMRLTAGLVKVLPSRSQDIIQEMRMALASDNDHLAADSLRGLWYWLKVSLDQQNRLVAPPIDLVREIGVIIATRRKATLSISTALQAAKWVFIDGSSEQRSSIGELAAQGLGFLIQELLYDQEHDPDLDVPLLRWGCTHLAIAMSMHGFDNHQGVVQWLTSAKTDPLPEVRYAEHLSSVSHMQTDLR